MGVPRTTPAIGPGKRKHLEPRQAERGGKGEGVLLVSAHLDKARGIADILVGKVRAAGREDEIIARILVSGGEPFLNKRNPVRYDRIVQHVVHFEFHAHAPIEL